MEVLILSITFFILIVAGFSTFYALKGHHQFYFISAISIYLFSYLTSFTVGIFIVGLAFVSLMLAIGYRFHWIQTRLRFAVFCLVGVFLGVSIVYYLPDYIFFQF